MGGGTTDWPKQCRTINKFFSIICAHSSHFFSRVNTSSEVKLLAGGCEKKMAAKFILTFDFCPYRVINVGRFLRRTGVGGFMRSSMVESKNEGEKTHTAR